MAIVQGDGPRCRKCFLHGIRRCQASTIYFYLPKYKISLKWILKDNCMIAYHRTVLAQQLVQSLQGRSLLGDAHNGLFLAAPRRTGKSTFLQGDVAPALQQAGVEVVYVDLWADTRRDPGTLIAEAIAKALQSHLGLVARAARKAGVKGVKVAGALDIDISKIGQVEGMTLVDALRSLHQAAGRAVALIIDEAQHALTSEAGEAAMTALKSARDQMNQPGHVNLMLVMSGSDRDKLLRLVVSAAAPFYGSQIQALPPLDTDFIAHVAGLVEAQRPDLVPVDRAALQAAFASFGHRPQFFMAAMGAVLSPLSGHNGRFEPALQQAAQDQQAQDEAQMESDYLGLKPTEQAVLWRMLDQGPRFRPYDAEALRFYREKLGRPVSVQQAQKALESLRQRTPALVWKSARSEYAVEDAAMHRWFQMRLGAGTWPPNPLQGSLPLDDE
ncbi:AAA family ATPase [Acidovorax sp. NCPPB 2350]|nr:AAA family ATPase [Acidovorax sp. NCPPB 2350]